MKAIIVHDGKILLLRESPKDASNTKVGKYQFPGGRIDPGEPFTEGLKREIKEETGMEVEMGQPFFIGEWFPTIKGVPHHIVAIFLRCSTKHSEVVLSDEHDDYRWISSIGEVDIMQPDDEVAKQFLNSHNNPK